MYNDQEQQQEAVGFNFILNLLAPNSPYGSEKIKNLKPFLKSEIDQLESHFADVEKIIELRKNHPHKVQELQLQLMQFKNIAGIITKCEQAALHEVELFEVKHFLLTFEKLYDLFLQHLSGLALNNVNFGSMVQLLDEFDPEKKRLIPFALNATFSKTLGEIQAQKLNVEAQMRINKTAELAQARKTLTIEELAEATKIMQVLSEKLRKFIPIFRLNLAAIAELDFLIAKATLAHEHGGTRPKISQTNTIILKAMTNPMIASALAKKQQTFTEISVTLTSGTTIITGANMGGKSVAMKTTVLNILLCQMGFYPFAKASEIPLFDRIFFLSGDLQSVDQGLSTFGADIFHLNNLIHKLKSEFIFIALDEFAKGTNPEEGAIIVKEVATYLSKRTCICVMSTHYDKIVAPNFKHYQIVGLDPKKLKHHQSTAFNDANLISQYMDYRLVEKNHSTKIPRDAFHICQLIGLDATLLQRIKAHYEDC